jgi:hypothetical protein
MDCELSECEIQELQIMQSQKKVALRQKFGKTFNMWMFEHWQCYYLLLIFNREQLPHGIIKI